MDGKYVYVTNINNLDEKYFKTRKAIAWNTFHKLLKIWSSNMSRNIKMSYENKVVLWTLTHGNINRGRRKKTYIDN